MRVLRVFVTVVTIVGVSSSAAAGDLQVAIAKAVEQPARPAQSEQRSMPKRFLWSGAALFAGGMAVAMNGFLNNRNGEFPEFGEAESTNVRMGAAGLTAAFGGGLGPFLGRQHAGRVPSLTFGPGRVSAAHQVRW